MSAATSRLALLGARRRVERRLEGRCIPLCGQLAPAGGSLAGARRGLLEAREEHLVANLRPQPARILEESLGAVDPRRGRVRVQVGDARRVAAQHGGLQARLADHVVGHQEEPLAGEPVVVPRDDALETFRGAGRRVLQQQQMEHGHEMALAAAEAPVQVGGLAGARRERALDQIERPVEGVGKLRGHDVGLERLGRIRHALGEPEDEVVAVDLLRDVDQVADQRHAGALGARADPRAAMISVAPSRLVMTVPPLTPGPGRATGIRRWDRAPGSGGHRAWPGVRPVPPRRRRTRRRRWSG